MGYAGFEPETSAPEVWCTANELCTTSPSLKQFLKLNLNCRLLCVGSFVKYIRSSLYVIYTIQ